jgi:hypothetical protein
MREEKTNKIRKERSVGRVHGVNKFKRKKNEEKEGQGEAIGQDGDGWYCYFQ